ncbi:MAG: hypothetical protein MK076_11620 [Flavobacteriales bacterium]|nr:hypothetical protein [Flavobacteriales bacterium]
MDRITSNKHTKIRGSSLVETLIATVLIMIVFGMGIATLGNVLEQTVKNNARFIDNELNRLEYLYQNNLLQVPDVIEIKDWQITIDKESRNNLTQVVFTATKKDNSKVTIQPI